MSLFQDLTGQRFGRLLVVAVASKAVNKKTQWLCLCDCGNQTIVMANNLKSHTRSCGCLLVEAREKTKQQAILELENNARRKFLRDYARHANTRGLSWELSDDQAMNLALANCHYCGVAPFNPAKIYDTRGGRVRVSALLLNGIDRVDNKIGYEFENCVSCCKICNYAKRCMTYAEFIEYLNRVIHFRKAL